jgi:hypothetical protein
VSCDLSTACARVLRTHACLTRATAVYYGQASRARADQSAYREPVRASEPKEQQGVINISTAALRLLSSTQGGTAAWRTHIRSSLARAEHKRGAAAAIGKRLTQLQAACQLAKSLTAISIDRVSLFNQFPKFKQSSSRQHTPACLSGRPHTRFRQRLCTSEGLYMTRRATVGATPQR